MTTPASTERTIFLEAIEKPSEAERNAFVLEACLGNPRLQAEVEVLLRAHRESGDLLDAPAAILPTTDHAKECVGALIGPYKLLEQIGEGGMGLVYMAEQQRPLRRLVALKLIKPGMDSKQVIARFEAEKQALAMMDHSNIAKVFEAGMTETGRFYFAMELVRGIPINEFCDQKRLTVRQRLELFIQVCQAVQHAHQKGIIHRDLKPSNVLVTMHDVLAVPKVIDFGIAKALGQQLTEHTLHTGFAQLVGTPLYMSPEQAEMNQLGVDTRSDVYSLGVLLYELLTGTTPFEKERLTKATLDEMRRIIREEEPETVSARIARTKSSHHAPRDVAQQLLSRSERATELDWIVMKSLEKDRTRRYESASALAADIQRYLSDEPVLACPPTTMYRFQKFARKHKPVLATAAAIALCLILGTTVSAWQAARATTAEAEANANAATAQEKEQEAIKQRDEVKALANKLAAKEQQLERTLYAAHMNLAHNAFEAGAPARLRELLAQHRPQPGEADLRGFEWHYLNRLFPADLLVLEHTGRVANVTYSPDGKLLATTSEGGLSVWDVETGDKLFSQPASIYATAAFSPDGKRVATPEKIWDAKTGRELLSLSTEARPGVFGVAFTPDGKQLATGSSPTTTSGQIAIWDAQTGEELRKLEGHRGQIRSLAFSPDGKRLASASADKTVMLWDAHSGEVIHTLKGHTAFVCTVAYSPDGKRLASASGDGTVKQWDPMSGNEIRTLEGHGGFNGVAFSPDGKRLAGGSQGNTVKVWDVESGDELFALKGHTRQVWSVAFSPDGKHLASAAVGGIVLVREAKPVQKALVFGGGPRGVGNMAFSPDGKRLTTLGQGEPRVWDTQTGEKLLAIDARSDSPSRPNESSRSNVALSLDGRRLAGGGGTFREGLYNPNRANSANIWDLLTGEKLLTIRGVGEARIFALSPDGSRLVVTNNPRITNQVWGAQPSQIFDTNTGQEIRSWKGPAGDMVFSPSGKLLAGYSGDKTLKLCDAQTGDEVLTIKGAAGPRAFSHDGKCLATASDDPTVVKLWNANTGQELLALKGHSGAVNHIAFSPDSKRLATTSNDDTIKVWDTETAQELLTLDGGGAVAFSPDGHRLAAGGPNGTVLIYDATPLPEKP